VRPRDEASAADAEPAAAAAPVPHLPPDPVAPAAGGAASHLLDLRLPDQVGGDVETLRLPWERERPPPPGTLVQWTL